MKDHDFTTPAERPTPITESAPTCHCAEVWPGQGHHPDCPVLLRVTDLERQLAEAREQRDRLAEALEELRNARWLSLPGRAGDIIEAALAAVKGGAS